MRILQLTSARYMGGGERHVADLSRALTDRGHEIFAGLAPDAEIRAHLSLLPDQRIVELPFRGPMDVVTARAIAKLATAENIDLIHAHVARDYTVAALASRHARVPFVITRHVLFPMTRLHRLLLRGTRFVIAPSDAVAESLRAQRIFSEEKIVTIRHGLHPPGLVAQRAINDGEFVIGSVGNLDPVKGFDVLIRAAAMVIEKVPQARFEIAGSDRESDLRNESELRQLISSLDLADRVILTGQSRDVHETIAAFDLFVSASRTESFGYALAEAMLSGVPVVASETEGAKEVVGDAGELVPIGSAEALAERVIELIQNSVRRERLSLEGQRRIREKFSIERMVEETEALYRRAIGSA